MKLESKLSKVSNRIKSSIIRELLKDASLPGIISFGGGVPDPKTFPREKLAEISSEIINKEYAMTLQYGTTEGDPLLKKEYMKLMEKYYGVDWLHEDNMVFTVGSQQALYLIGMTFLDEQSWMSASKPIYLGAASAFIQRGPNFINVPLTEDGMDLDYLEKNLEELKQKGEIDNFKFAYVISNFHNPAGVSMSLDKRRKLIQLAEKYDFYIVEDDPYGALRFEGDPIPSIYSMAPERTVLLNTFSKVLSPGLRIGAVMGPKDVIRRITMVKQAADLCSSPLTHRLAARYMEKYDLVEEIQPTIKLYAKKKDWMMEALEETFSDIEGIEWVNPEGGLFTWLTLPEGIDTMDMFPLAKENKVLYIPGEAFYIGEPERNKMRMSFCLPPKEDIFEGIKRLRKTIETYCEEKGIELKIKTKK